MSHELHLHKIGPINDCRLTLDTFTVLTGPQANGKSTVAKPRTDNEALNKTSYQAQRGQGNKNIRNRAAEIVNAEIICA